MSSPPNFAAWNTQTLANFAHEVDEMRVDTVCELMQLEEVTPTQRNLHLMPISEGYGDSPRLTR